MRCVCLGARSAFVARVDGFGTDPLMPEAGVSISCGHTREGEKMKGAASGHLPRVSAACIVGFCLVGSSRAIVVSDAPDNHVITPPSDYDGVGNLIYQGLPGGSTAVLIDPWHILTAKHAISPGAVSDHTFALDLAEGRIVYSVAERFLHPSADIAVARLQSSAKHTGYALYTGSSEATKTGILVGYGMSGTGLTGPDPNYPRGTKRSGSNRIDLVASDPNGVPYLVMDFDGPGLPGPYGPGTLGASKEVMFAPGDSGGPTFLSIGGTLCVAGIHSALWDYNNNGLAPDYTDVGYDVRVSEYVSWIQSRIPPLRTLTVTVTNALFGHVNLSPEPADSNVPQYPSGVWVTLTAIPNDGRSFGQWTLYDPNHPDDLNFATIDANTVITIRMDTDRQVEAAFSCGAGLAFVLPLVLGMSALSGWVRHVRTPDQRAPVPRRSAR